MYKNLKLVFIHIAVVGSFATPAVFALDAETLTEVRRIDQRISGFSDNIQQILQDVRTLQRKMEKIERIQTENAEKIKEFSDTIIRMQNTDIANLIAVDKQLAQRLNSTTNHIEKETTTWNWGSEARGCEDVGKHQQIQSVRSADGKFSLRYLCFDGKAIHLGTEVNLPPQ